MNIRQINISYLAEEDRLLLRVIADEVAEFRFWLTRANVRHFLPQINSWLLAADAQPGAVATQHAFKREVAAAEADFSSPLTAGQSFPLGEAPLLITELRLIGSGEAASLHLSLADERQISINLDEKAMASLQRLIREIAHSADWGIDLNVNSGLATRLEQSLHLH